MLHYYAKSRPHLVVIFTRDVSELANAPNADQQAQLCLRYCRDNHITVSHTVRVRCGPEESLHVLRSMLRNLPAEVDAILASDFYVYSTLLPELYALCLVYQCHPAWLYSLDLPGPIYRALNTGSLRDYDLAESRYHSLTGKSRHSR